MEVSLICSNNKKQLLQELLSARNIGINEHADICIAEAGLPAPQDKLCLVFHASNIFTLMELLDKCSGLGGTREIDMIVGRAENDVHKTIPFSQINYFESRGNHTYCKTVDGEYRVREKLLSELPPILYIHTNQQ